MRLNAYGPGRFQTKTLSSGDVRVKDTQSLLGAWGRRSVAMKDPERIIAAEEIHDVDNGRKSPGAVAGG